MKNILLAFLLFFSCCVQAQIITTFAGTGLSGALGLGGPATAAHLPNPCSGAFDRLGNYCFAELKANRILKVDTAGIMTCVAGNGSGGFLDNIPATAAEIYGPTAVKLDTSGNMYICDEQNGRVRKVNATTGFITTIAGTGTGAFSGDGGPATAADLWGIQDVCVDKFGNVFIADGFNYRIRKVTPAGMISTVVGTGTAGYSGENTRADTSRIGFVSGLCTDTAGNLYIGDNSGGRVLKVDLTGYMKTVAGNGIIPYGGDGIPATAASLDVLGIFVDKPGNLFIADRYNTRVYKVDSVGILHLIAGTGVLGDTGDGGPATDATLYTPVGVAVDECGNAYVPTIGSISVPGSGKRIRKVILNPTCHTHLDSTTLNVAKIGSKEMWISPNPTTSELHINSITPGTTYQLLNNLGATMQTGTLRQSNSTLSLTHLPPGIYLLTLTDEQGRRTITKIVKE